MYSKTDENSALSPVIAEMLLVAITIILIAILFLFSMNYHVYGYTPPEEIPVIFEISKVSSSFPDYEGKITLRNAGVKPYTNSLLEAEIYSNDVLLGCRIETMNGYEFISTHHYFVKTMGGMGCSDTYWYPGEKIALDISDGLIKPGNLIRVDILQKPDHKVISRDTYKLPKA